jgi:hypothetical protein
MQDIRRISTAQKPEEKKEEPTPPMMASHMTPEYIVGKLFDLHNTAHFYHFQTDSHATHKALDHLYERLVHLKDEIPEFILGMQVPRRFEYITLSDVKPYNETALLKFLDEGCMFGKQLCEYADGKGWEALEDMAGHICKEFTHTKLLISYK